MRRVTIRFYGDLRELATDADRAGEVEVPVGSPRSVKDAIETCGVPHTEVDLVLVDGTSVDFGALLAGSERVSAYPPFLALDVGAVSRVRPEALDPRFALDVHLGRLAERLRVLGFDSAYRNDFDDEDLVELAATERRWLLTRDRGILMRTRVTHGYLVRSSDPDTQIREVVSRFQLAGEIAPFTRCPRCNGRLEAVDKAEVLDRLEPGTRANHDEFARCDSCQQLYWEGSHHGSLRAFVASIGGMARNSATGAAE